MDIKELLKKHGVELPEEKAAAFDKEFRQSWKHHSEIDAKVKALETATATIADRDKQLEALKKVDASALQAEIARLQEENKNAGEKHAKELATIQKTAALKLAFADKLHDPDDIIRILDMEKVEIDTDGKLKAAADELLAPYKESKSHLFKPAPKPPQIKGAKLVEGADLSQLDTGFQSKLDEARKTGNTNLAVQIKSEAAEQGIILR